MVMLSITQHVLIFSLAWPDPIMLDYTIHLTSPFDDITIWARPRQAKTNLKISFKIANKDDSQKARLN